MKKLLLIAVLLACTILQQGCGTMKGLGSFVSGIGSDIADASDGYNREYYNKHNRPRH
jgi:predicted small secreted protein